MVRDESAEREEIKDKLKRLTHVFVPELALICALNEIIC